MVRLSLTSRRHPKLTGQLPRRCTTGNAGSTPMCAGGLGGRLRGNPKSRRTPNYRPGIRREAESTFYFLQVCNGRESSIAPSR